MKKQFKLFAFLMIIINTTTLLACDEKKVKSNTLKVLDAGIKECDKQIKLVEKIICFLEESVIINREIPERTGSFDTKHEDQLLKKIIVTQKQELALLDDLINKI